MDKDDVIKFIDGKVYYYSDYINFLYKQLELKDNVIKEIREEMENTKHISVDDSIAIIKHEKRILEILDKGE